MLAAEHAVVAAGIGNAADGRQGRHRGNDAELQALDLKIASITAVVASVAVAITLRYRVRDHEVLVKSIDLTKDNWQDIHDDLLAIPMSFREPSPADRLAA